MTQIILDVSGNAVVLPESQKGGYSVWAEQLGEMVQMISGRQVLEVRGEVYCASYQYGYFTKEEKDKIVESCRKGKRQPVKCTILLQDNTSYTGDFFVTELKEPTFMWSSNGKNGEGEAVPAPVWADLSFTIREVQPHD